MKKLLITITLVAFSVVSHAQWIPQTANITPGNGIPFIDAVSPDVCWGIVGDPTSQSAPFQEYTRTNDGGMSWTSGPITNAAGLVAADICAISASTAWAVFWDPAAVQGKIVKTDDGGATWTHQSTALFNAAGNFPNWIHFWDPNNGVCLGDPTGGYFEIYTTVDGGTNWVRVPSADITPILSGEFGIVDVSATYGDSVIWFGTNVGRIYKSTDRGYHWSAVQTPIVDYIGAIAFRDENNGIAKIGGPNVSVDLVRTSDGGSTWNLVNTNTANFVLSHSIAYLPGTDSTYFISVDSASGALRGTAYSPDNGTHWIPVDALNHTDIDFVNDSTGWTGSWSAGGLMYKWSNLIITATTDVSSLRITVPTNTGLVTQNPTARFFNDGLNTQTFSVTMTITGGYSSTKTVTNLAFFDSTQITFDPWTPATAGTYAISIYTSLAGDVNNANDTLVNSVTVYEAFENYGWVSKPNLSNGVFGAALAFKLNGFSSSSPGILYSVGGANNTGAVQGSMNTFSDVTNLWSSATAMPSGKYQFSAIRAGNKIVCSGGYSGGFIPDASTYIYNTTLGTWGIGTPMPLPVGDYAAGVYHDSLVYYIGGYDGAGDVNDVQFYNVNTNTWNTATAKIGTPVDALRGDINGNTIVVACGYSQATFGPIAEAYKGIIDPAFPTQITWTALPDYPAGTASRLAAGTVFNDFKPIVIFAGGDPTGAGTEALDQCWGYDISLNQWLIGTPKTTGVSNISNLAGVIYNDSLWMVSVAGYDGVNFSTVNEWLNIGGLVWTGVKNTANNNSLSIYPNPVQDELIVSGNFNKGNVIISLKNVLGQTVSEQKKYFRTAENNFRLNVSGIPAGVYMMQINDSESTIYTAKIIKQ